MAYDRNNIFAKILRSEIPCNKVYEDQYALAFYDISPAAPVHILVIPKGEFTAFSDFMAKASSELILGFHKAITKVIQELKLETSGYRLVSNCGEDAGQTVAHLHFHILAGESLGGLVGQ
jgi:diadenosine tetraphosphate (Ap4A) HIT family hydrolase